MNCVRIDEACGGVKALTDAFQSKEGRIKDLRKDVIIFSLLTL